MNSFLNKLLDYYQININDLNSRNAVRSFNDLTLPYNDAKFLSVCNRIKKAKDNNEKVVIYGDYDVDGLTSVSILKLSLDKLKINCGYFIPSRYIEGYGIVIDRIKQFKDKGYNLIITVDNGISKINEIEYAKSLGMEVIVIDHHEITSLPNTDYIFHQNLSKFINYNCSAASLAFFVASYLLDNFDPYLATLAGIAVFSDVMPLVGNNLIFAKLMLEFINKYKYANLLSLIKDVSSNNKITYHQISFEVISKLNAVGRVLTDSMATIKACQLLLNPYDLNKIETLSKFIEDASNLKKDVLKNYQMISSYTLESDHCQSYVLNCLSGVAGLIANRLMQKNNKPTIVYAISSVNSDQLVGSIRVPDGYDVTSILDKYKHLFIECGGHKKAAGVTIDKKNYFQVMTFIAMEFSLQSSKIVNNEKYVEVEIEELNDENYNILNMFQPFGEGFAEPKFSLEAYKENVLIVPNKFIKYSKSSSTAIYFSADNIPENFDSVIFVGKFTKNVFNGKTTYQLNADKVFFEN